MQQKKQVTLISKPLENTENTLNTLEETQTLTLNNIDGQEDDKDEQADLDNSMLLNTSQACNQTVVHIEMPEDEEYDKNEAAI